MSIVCELLSCIRAIYIGLHMLIRSSSSHPDTSILCFDCFSYSVSPHFTSHENLLQRLAQPHCTCSCLTPFHSVLPLECCEQYSIYVDICLFIECEIAKYIRFIFFLSMHTYIDACVCVMLLILYSFLFYWLHQLRIDSVWGPTILVCLFLLSRTLYIEFIQFFIHISNINRKLREHIFLSQFSHDEINEILNERCKRCIQFIPHIQQLYIVVKYRKLFFSLLSIIYHFVTEIIVQTNINTAVFDIPSVVIIRNGWGDEGERDNDSFFVEDVFVFSHIIYCTHMWIT